MNLIRKGKPTSWRPTPKRRPAAHRRQRHHLPLLPGALLETNSHKEYPNIHIKVTNQTSIECAHFLKNGQADFIVTNYPNSALTGNLNVRVINEVHRRVRGQAPAFPLAGRPVSLTSCWGTPS